MGIMKRLLSVLLAVLMLCGVGAVGAWALDMDLGEEYWNDGVNLFDHLAFDEVMEIRATVGPLRAYHNYASFFKDYPEIEKERAAALKVPETPYYSNEAFLGAFNLAGQELAGSTYGNLRRYLRGTLQEEAEQAILDADAYLKTIFTEAYFNQFKAYQAAFASGDYQMRRLRSILSYYEEEIVNYDEIEEDYNAFVQWYNSSFAPVRENGKLADLTAVYEEEAVRAKAIIAKIKFAGELVIKPAPFWDAWPGWLVSILRYALFGWLWMRWL